MSCCTPPLVLVPRKNDMHRLRDSRYMPRLQMVLRLSLLSLGAVGACTPTMSGDLGTASQSSALFEAPLINKYTIDVAAAVNPVNGNQGCFPVAVGVIWGD